MTEEAAASPTPEVAASHRTNIVFLALRITLVILGLAGWLVSSNLAMKSLAPDRSNALLDAVCGDAAGGDPCASVLTSEAAYVQSPGYPAIPWAVLGAGYFAFVGIWYLFAGLPNRRGSWWHMLILLVVIYGGFVSLQMMQVMATQLKTWCMGCVIVHVINGLIIALSLLAAWLKKPAEPGSRARPSAALALSAFTSGSLFFVFMLVAFFAAGYRNQTQKIATEYNQVVGAPDYVLWQYDQQTDHSELFTANPAQLAYGDDNAVNVVTSFVDLRCKRCRDASKLLRKMVDEQPGELRLEYRHFPLNHDCNPNADERLRGNASCDAALLTETIRAQHGVEDALTFMDQCYAQAPFYDRGFLLEKAAAWQIDETALAGGEADRAAESLASDLKLGTTAEVTRAPTVFFNGRRLPTWNSEKAWQALLERGE